MVLRVRWIARHANARARAGTALLLTSTVAMLSLAGPVATTASGGRIVLRVLHLVDRSRTIRLPNGGVVARPITTYLRYPGSGHGPWPLVVFGHGYAATPGLYAHLLRAWTLAGYVVAAPLFPLGNANALGGPNESDIVNQPRDISYVISQLLKASASHTSALHGLVDPSRIAVAGQSDGGDTAFAAAYDPSFRDPRIDAAIILSGAQLPGVPFSFPNRSPPLLATQGTADNVNPPSDTYAFFGAAPRPKFLLTLLGAGHVPPYTTEEPQLRVVERVTIAFLNHYLKHGAIGQIEHAAAAPSVAALATEP
jgi:dienelactone hydrolase